MKYLITLMLTILVNEKVNSQCADSMIDCTGQCGKFIDLNHDNFCDYSILSIIKKSEVKDSFVAEKIERNFVEINHKESIQKANQLKKNSRLSPIIKCTVTKDCTISNSIIPSSTNRNNKKPIPSQSPYHLLSILIPMLIAAILMKRLVVKNVIRNITYTRFWNVLLLISFLITAILGMLLVVKINYGLEIPYLRYCYIFHVDFGIAMSIISFLHLIWHLKYYYKLISK